MAACEGSWMRFEECTEPVGSDSAEDFSSNSRADESYSIYDTNHIDQPSNQWRTAKSNTCRLDTIHNADTWRPRPAVQTSDRGETGF